MVKNQQPTGDSKLMPSPSTGNENFSRNLLFMSGSSFIGSALVVIISISQLTPGHAWQIDAAIAALAVNAIYCAITFVLSRTRVSTNVISFLFLIVFLIMSVTLSLVIQGLGRFLMIAVIILGTSGSLMTLTPKFAERGIILSAVTGICALLIDFYIPDYQFEMPQISNLVAIITGLITVIFLISIFRQFSNLSVGIRLLTLTAFSIISLGVFAAFAFNTLDTVQVTGPLYQQFTQDQALVADILPPPAYIIESYLAASQLLDAAAKGDRASVNSLIEKLSALQKEYDARQAYWNENLIENTDVKQAFLVDSYQPAQDFYEAVNNQLIPAIQAGNLNKAGRIFDDVLTPAYESHRSAIDRVIQLQRAAIQIEETTAQSLINRSTTLLVTLIIGTALITIILGFFIARSIVTPVSQLALAANQIAGGNLEVQASINTTDEIGLLARSFNSMTAQLKDNFSTLEQRVAARTQDLATVAEVGTATATILDTDKLLQAVVELTKERFNLYHSHIYLLDETGENLVLARGAGEAGAQMKARGLSIPLDREQSLVARAAREGKGVTVNDVTQVADFLPNPLLPDTRSELAAPMIIGGKVIGVFDIQSDVVGRFTESDVNIQTTLAAQVAISIQNVRSFEQSKAQADLESLVNAIGQKIQRATTVEDTLQTAIREVGLALGAARVTSHITAKQPHHINS